MFCPKKHNHSFVHLHILLCHSPDSLIQRQTLAGSDITRNKKSLVFLLQAPASTTALQCNAIDALMQHTINTTVFFSTRALMQRDIKRNSLHLFCAAETATPLVGFLYMRWCSQQNLLPFKWRHNAERRDEIT